MLPQQSDMARRMLLDSMRRRVEFQHPQAHEFWRRGDLSYKWKPVQHQMDHDLSSNRSLKQVINCSRRIGKTYYACTKAIQKAITKPGSHVRFAAATRASLRNIVHPLMKEIGKDAPETHKPMWYAPDSLYRIAATGSEIHMAGCNNGHEEDSRGTWADMAIVEEAGLVKNLSYVVNDILMPQLLGRDAQLLMISTPPRTPVHDFVTYAQEAKIKGAYAEYDIYKSGYPETLIAQFCEEAGGQDSTTWKREYLCQFVVDSNFAIVPEWKDDFVQEINRDELFRFYFTYDGMDTGIRDLTVVLFGYYDFQKAKLFVEDEVVMNGPQMTTEKLANAIKAKEKELWGAKAVHQRIADNDNLILIQDMGMLHGLYFSPTSKDTLEAMVNQLRVWVAKGRVIVSPKCTQAVGCLKYAIWNERRDKFERSSLFGHFDALAALIYLVRNIDEQTNPIPLDFNLDRTRMFVHPDVTKAKTHEAVKGLFSRKRNGLR